MPLFEPHRLPELKGPESLRQDIAGRARFRQSSDRFVDTFGGHREGSEMHADAFGRFKVEVRLYGFGRIHVNRLHEPARLVGADWQQRQIDRPQPATLQTKREGA